jgi:hypothetical protein
MHWVAVDYNTGTIYIGKITKIDEVSKNAEASFLSKMDGNRYKVKTTTRECQLTVSIYHKYILPHSS